MLLGYRCANSRHDARGRRRPRRSSTTNPYEVARSATSPTSPRRSSASTRREGSRSGSTKVVAYHTSRGRARRASCRPLPAHPRPRGPARPRATTQAEQRAWLDAFWAARDVEVGGARPAPPRSSRRSAGTCSSWPRPRRAPTGTGVPAKGVTGSGYDGHYFWDTEIYVAPVPDLHARPSWRATRCASGTGCCRPRATRARELSQRGALFPWRTINGEEASAYYAAGTAQYHIDADVALRARASTSTPPATSSSCVREGVDIARRDRADVGRPRLLAHADGDGESFHIHGVTGPDEYTTVVNDNLFTNVMARFNLRCAAARAWRWPRGTSPSDVSPGSADRLALDRRRGRRVGGRAAGMHIPFDDRLWASTRRTTPSSTARCGTSSTRPTSSARCCCTTTRW